ncbi:hypothetical protein CRM22_002940 [Opisthorchis felineus]|uniref:Uncharacterized protein n=1 Tax=Opisthorchis felineus TaxID=147828 RepID=A0A4S2M886_OPIFE|nr:hypothetical protein CRM22_002940 [Opisthorchis felineus]
MFTYLFLDQSFCFCPDSSTLNEQGLFGIILVSSSFCAVHENKMERRHIKNSARPCTLTEVYGFLARSLHHNMVETLENCVGESMSQSTVKTSIKLWKDLH